jgi:hypothetical protein
MKRVILSLLIGWVVLYTTNHLLLPASHKPFELHTQPSTITTDRHINSWGPYLTDVPASRPNRPDRIREPRPLEELASNQSDAESPGKSEPRPVTQRLAPSPELLKSVEIDKSAPKLELNQRSAEPPAKDEARPVIERLASTPAEFLKSAEIAKDGPEFTSNSETHPSVNNEVRPVLQSLAPTSAERLTKSTKIATNPRVALNLSEERPEKISRVVENPPISTGESRKSIATNVEPRPTTDVKPDQNLSLRTPTIEDRRTSARHQKSSGDVNDATTRLAEAVPNLDGRSHLAPIPKSRGLGLFMFAPPGF